MLPFGVTIPVTVPQRLEFPEGLTNYPVSFSTYVIYRSFSEGYIHQMAVISGHNLPLSSC